MIAPRHEIASLQSDFFRQQYHRVLRWLVYSLVVIFILILSIIYTILFQPTPTYYGNTTEGKILPMPKPRA